MPIVWCVIFATGFIAGMKWPRPQPSVFYGLRVQRVLPPDSMQLISPETGPFRADFCPENKVLKYEPRAGYVLCKLQYVDRGCMDISGKVGKIIWVKDQFGSTATLNENETFSPWPQCQKDEEEASAR